ncbi:TIR-like protein FxsC [Streptomyces sp. NPDC086549]|uniref:TIR-like protein FxsC n=1 Tax=Streptomyces sp. NPDC086549 TaxID=3365752 RepID=UPI0037F9C1D4
MPQGERFLPGGERAAARAATEPTAPDGILREELARLLGAEGAPDAGDALDVLWIARLSGIGPVDWSLVGDGTDPTAAPPPADPLPPPPPDTHVPEDTGPEPPPARLHLPDGNGAAHGGRGAAQTVRVTQPQALTDALALGRALRPLRQTVPSARARTLDVPATAAASGDTGLLLPVLRPATERRFSVDLLIDTGTTMTVWHRLADELHTLLARHGAFAEVRAWALHTDTPEPTVAPFRRGAQAPSPTRRWRQALADPTGRHVVLIFTDAVGPAWYGTELPAVLAAWSRERSVAALQVLPSLLWHRTALRPAPVRARGTEAARATLEVSSSMPLPGIARGRHGAADRARIRWLPVLELSGTWLTPWTRLVSGRTTEWTPLSAAPLTVVHRPAPALAADEPTTPAGWIERFEEGHSPEAFRLLRLLAAAPLSLPVVRLIQRTMFPASTPTHLAELFLSGILVRRSPAHPGEDPDSVLYDFRDGVREALLDRLTRTESLRVLRQVIEGVSERVESTLGGVTDFAALVAAAGEEGGLDGLELPEESRAFAEVALAVLSGVGGDYAEVAARLAGAVGSGVSSAAAAPEVAEERGRVRRAWLPWRWRRAQAVPVDVAPVEVVTEAPVEAESSEAAESSDAGRGGPSRIPELPEHYVARATHEVEQVLLRASATRHDGFPRSFPVQGTATCVIEGGPGVGKTALAIACARHLAERFSMVRWIRAHDSEILYADLAAFALDLGIGSVEAIATDQGGVVVDSPNYLLSRIHTYLRENPGWLLVFDGASAGGLRIEDGGWRSRPWRPPEGYGSVLVTLRGEGHWPWQHTPVVLDGFTRREALEFVWLALARDRGELLADDELLADLVDVVGTNPLALNRTVEKLRSNGTPIGRHVMSALMSRQNVIEFSPSLVWITRGADFVGTGVAVSPDTVVVAGGALFGRTTRVHYRRDSFVPVSEVFQHNPGLGVTLLKVAEAVLTPARVARSSVASVAAWYVAPLHRAADAHLALRPVSSATRGLRPGTALIDAEGRLCYLVSTTGGGVTMIDITPELLNAPEKRVQVREKPREPLFYLSYARANHTGDKRDSRVQSFFDLLTTFILQMTSYEEQEDIGLFNDGAALGRDWQEQLQRAVSSARVFVPLYSPRYFTSEWCGREWEAFRRRSSRSTEPWIMPVIWSRIDPAQLPLVARRVQYTSREFSESYTQVGLLGLLESGRHNQYRRAVWTIAQNTVEMAQSSRLRPVEPTLFDDLRNAFDEGRPGGD